MGSGRTNFASRVKTLFAPVMSITSGSWLDQSSNIVAGTQGIYPGYVLPGLQPSAVPHSLVRPG